MSGEAVFGGNYSQYLGLELPAPVSEKQPVGRPTDVDQTVPRRVMSLRFSHELHDLLHEAIKVSRKSRVRLFEEMLTAYLPWIIKHPGQHVWDTEAREEMIKRSGGAIL